MGLWDDFKKDMKKAAEDPARKRKIEREQEKSGALMVVRQSEYAEVSPKRLLIFEDRVELHDRTGFFKTDVKAMRYAQIAGVHVEGRVIRADLVIESTGGDKIVAPKLAKDDAQSAHELIQKKMSERDTALSPAASASPADPTEQIRKLAELRDIGAVSEEEFERKKTELLERL